MHLKLFRWLFLGLVIVSLGACTAVLADPTATPRPFATVSVDRITLPEIERPAGELDNETLQVAIDELPLATTSEQEEALFWIIWENAESLSVLPFDANGDPIDTELADWWVLADQIELRINGQVVAHTLIDPENAQIFGLE